MLKLRKTLMLLLLIIVIEITISLTSQIKLIEPSIGPRKIIGVVANIPIF